MSDDMNGWRPIETAPKDVNAHESAADHDTIMASYQAEAERCFAIAQRLDAMRPDEPGAFTGTPSERIQRQLIAIGALANGE